MRRKSGRPPQRPRQWQWLFRCLSCDLVDIGWCDYRHDTKRSVCSAAVETTGETMANSKKSGTVYQLKIVLAGTRPPIWRRVQVQNCNLTKLHEIIQRAMGWYGGHLWAFEVDGEQYGENPWGGSDMDMMSSRSIKPSQLVDEGVTRFRYIYDFGDNWEHVVTVEKTWTLIRPPSTPIARRANELVHRKAVVGRGHSREW